MQGGLLRELGDLVGAETCCLRILDLESAAGDAAQARRLRGTARHQLAGMLRAYRRDGAAEAQWRAALAEEPGLTAGWLGLGELFLEQRRWPELEQVLDVLGKSHAANGTAVLLRARAHLARRECAAARQVQEPLLAAALAALGPRVLWSHILLQEDQDPAAAEQALRDVLALDPDNAEAQHNLTVLRRQQGRIQPV
jgi:tetratricopeptide (TPR) repeat protein